MQPIGLLVVHHVKTILFVAGMIVITEITLCALGFAQAGERYSVAKALETTGGFLMTLTSPDGLKPSSALLLAARCLGWVVSFMGWVTLPLLLGLLLSKSQSVEEEKQELWYNLYKRAERLGASPSDAEAYASRTMRTFETFAPEKGGDVGNIRTGDGSDRKHEA